MALEVAMENKSIKGVRHLCDSGITEIPEKYIFPISDRLSRSKIITEDNKLTLPVIDLSLLQTPRHRVEALELLSNACKTFGFFRVYIYTHMYIFVLYVLYKI